MELSAVSSGRASGSLFEFRKDPLSFLARNFDPLSPGFRFRVGWRYIDCVTDPEIAIQVLRQTEKKFFKNRFYKKFQPAVGQGLGTSEGALWKKQRRLVQPAFHPKLLELYAQSIEKIVVSQIDMVERAARDGRVISLHKLMSELTLKIFLGTMFGVSSDHDWDQIIDAFNTVSIHQGTKFDQLISLPEYIPTPANNRFRQAIAVIDEFINRLIAENRAKKPDGLLTSLIDSIDDSGQEQMTVKQLRDEIVTFIIGGHDTSSVLGTWLMVHLYDHPEIEGLAHEELSSVVTGETPQYQDLEKLAYLGQVINESMRISPPAWLLARVAGEDQVINNLRFEKGRDIFISPYLLHRHPLYWVDGTKFKPERFASFEPDDRRQNAFIPFGAGTRICIGKQFSYVANKILFGALIKKFKFEIQDRKSVRPMTALTLQPCNSVPVKLIPR